MGPASVPAIAHHCAELGSQSFGNVPAPHVQCHALVVSVHVRSCTLFTRAPACNVAAS